MSLKSILDIIATVCFALAGIWGLIVLFKDASKPWKWVGLAGIVLCITTLFQIYLPNSVYYALEIDIGGKIYVFDYIRIILIPLFLFLGMLGARKK